MWTLLGPYYCVVSSVCGVFAESLRYQRFDNVWSITLLLESKISLELVHRFKHSRQAEYGEIYIRNALMAARIWNPNLQLSHV